MQKLKLGNINCRTEEEQEMVLDIFEMLGYKWNAGQKPRGYESNVVPMCYEITNREKGKIIQGDCVIESATEAKNLRNMWISLKRRTSEHEIK